MGFIIFVIVAIVAMLAAGGSLLLAGGGIVFLLLNRKKKKYALRTFLTGGLLTFLVLIIYGSVVSYPVGKSGSNYNLLLSRWTKKTAFFILVPGVSCLLAGTATFFCPNKNE